MNLIFWIEVNHFCQRSNGRFCAWVTFFNVVSSLRKRSYVEYIKQAELCTLYAFKSTVSTMHFPRAGGLSWGILPLQQWMEILKMAQARLPVLYEEHHALRSLRYWMQILTDVGNGTMEKQDIEINYHTLQERNPRISSGLQMLSAMGCSPQTCSQLKWLDGCS